MENHPALPSFGGHGSVRFRVGLDDLFQPEGFCEGLADFCCILHQSLSNSVEFRVYFSIFLIWVKYLE